MLKQKLSEDLKELMKAKSKFELVAVRGIIADIKNKEIEFRRELTNEEIIGLIDKSIGQLRETKGYAEKLKDNERIKESDIKIEFLTKYLPAPLTEGEVRELISGTVSSLGLASKRDMGKLMKEIIPKVKGRFDSKKISVIAGEYLK